MANDDVPFPVGIRIISEMSKAELIEEIMENQKARMEALKVSDLRARVADFRLQEARKRILREAGLVERPGILGSFIESVDDAESE